MLKIRLSQVGKKHQRSYRIVVAEARSKRDGKSTEILGHYDSDAKPPSITINQKRLEYWLAKGARPTETVSKILENEKTR